MKLEKCKKIVQDLYGLTRAEVQLFELVLKKRTRFNCESLKKETGYDLSTIQRFLKKMNDHLFVFREKESLSPGGYKFMYETRRRSQIINSIKFDMNVKCDNDIELVSKELAD